MYDIRKLFEHKPDHPMTSVTAARHILDELAKTEAGAALEQIAHWIGTLRDFDGFACDDRFEILAEVESAGRRRVGRVFDAFFAHVHKRDREQRRLFELLQTFWVSLAGAYGRCVTDHERGEHGAPRMQPQLALAVVRAIRAAGTAEQLRQLRYVSEGQHVWELPYRLISYAEKLGCDATAVTAYEHEVHTNARAELLRMLGMSLAALHELPPEQVELAGRVMARYAISFAWSVDPEPGCNFVVDLALPSAPWQLKKEEPAVPTKRYFGGGPALAKLHEIEDLAANNLLSEEARYGREFSQAQIVTVIRHLQIYLGINPPHRRFPRAKVNDAVLVVKGFRAICQRVTTLELGSGMTLGEDLSVEQRNRSGMRLEAEEIESVPETWHTRDRSEWGMGIDIPAGAGEWTEPGMLCGIRENEASPWWVGIIRRLDAEEAGRLHCGLWIMSKRPISVHLRVIGTEENKATNWESSSGGFQYRYMRALMLPDAVKAHDRPVILIERQDIGMGEICEIMVGEHSRHIELVELIEQGADYMRVGFAWKLPSTHK